MPRTSLSLDPASLQTMEALAKRWSVSKAEVMRRALRCLKEEAEQESRRPTQLQALEWLQGGGGLSTKEGADFKNAVELERRAKRYWWQV